jgi:hypothetical protein
VRRLAAVQAAIDEQNRADAGQPPPAAPRRARKPAAQHDAPLADAAESPKRTRRPRATVRTLPAGT